MDVIKTQQISARLIEKMIVLPLVLLSIVDNYNRVAKDSRKRVVGVLLGSTYKGVVDVSSSYAGKGPSRREGVTVIRTNGKANCQKEMVTPLIRASLVKQGYKIIGSHSGVKNCRWTKSQLRGRGCYKHSFYGIESPRCMETTPSLACANKCAFCWRHHTNPVGKSWQWKMDDPLVIVNSATGQHSKMIKQMKGAPGTVCPSYALTGDEYDEPTFR